VSTGSTYAKPSIAGLGGTIEEAEFTLKSTSTNPTEQVLTLYNNCENCPKSLILSSDVQISYRDRFPINPKSLKQNRTYKAGLISYNKENNTVSRIILRKD
jgi:hypothetical protein